MNRTKVKAIEELPELPFEKVLSYLSLEDRLKARAVSRSWCHQINSFRVRSLCYARRPFGFIEEQCRLISGAYAQNFIFSTKFGTFFNAFGRSILSNLKNLRLFDLDLKEVSFAQTLISFGKLQELGLFGLYKYYPDEYSDYGDDVTEFELNLPMLSSLQIERVYSIKKVTFDTPRLKKIRLVDCSSLNLVIVHGESVERLLADQLKYIEVESLKNLQYIYIDDRLAIDSTLLSGLDQLKEVHTMDRAEVAKLFEQKRRYGRSDLKIYLCGLRLNGPDDPAIDSESTLVRLAENPSRLADEIPFLYHFDYSAIEGVDPEVTIDLVSRCTDLKSISLSRPVQDIERFLGLLKKFQNIGQLCFGLCDQPQDLYDRLPEHSAVQMLTIYGAPSSLEFLSRLKHLNHLAVRSLSDVERIRKLLKELPFLSFFVFDYKDKQAIISKDPEFKPFKPGPYRVRALSTDAEVPELEAAIQLLLQSR